MQIPFFADRLGEYLETRLSRTPNVATIGSYIDNPDVPDDVEHVQIVCGTPNVVGAYSCTGLYRVGAMEKAMDARGEGAVMAAHAGCIDDDVGLCPTAFMEIDFGSVEEQLANISRVEHATGLRFSLITMSGDTRPESVKAAEELMGCNLPKVKAGKSIHFELLLTVPLDPTKPKQEALRLRIQRLLAAVLDGDTMVKNKGRLMRAGGVVGGVNGSTSEGVRIQTLIRADPSAHFTAKDIDRRLSDLAKEMYGHSSDAWLENAMRVLADSQILATKLGYMPRVIRRELLKELKYPTNPMYREHLAKLTDRNECRQDGPRPKGKNKGPATSGDGVVSRWDAKTILWGPLLEAGGITVHRSNKNGYHSIECPFPHSSGKYSSGTDCVDPTKDIPGWFKCLHGSCQDRNAHDLLLHLEELMGREEMCKYVKYRAAPSIRNPFKHRKRAGKTKTTKAKTKPRWFADAAGALSELPKDNKIVILAGALGSGKTYYLGQEIAKVDRALIIMHRRALSRDLASRMKITDYQDMDPDELITRTKYPKIVVTPNSLHKVPTVQEPTDDLIILEEAESTISHFYGGTMRRTKRQDGGQVNDPGFGDELVGGDAFALHLLMIKRCIDVGGKLLLSDAHPGPVTERYVEIVCEHLGLDPDKAIHVVDHEVRLGWHLHAHDQLADVVTQMAEDVRAGKRIAVACMSARAAVALSQAAKSWRTDKGKAPTLLLHYQEQDKASREALKNVKKAWAAPDLVIYSPTVDSGVDYDVAEHPFDHRYLITSRGGTNHNGVPSLGWRIALQMSRRVRDCAVKNKDITAYMDPSWRHHHPLDSYEVRESMLERSKLATILAEETAPDGTTFKTALRDREHFEVAVAVETARRADSEDGPDLVRQAFKLAGVRVVEHATELSKEQLGAFREMWTALKAEHDLDKARAWYEANFITTDELLQLRHQADLDDEQRHSVERAKRIDFFGKRGGELERLVADIRGKERAMVRASVMARLITEGHLDKAAAYDRATVEAGYNASHTVNAMQVWGLLDALETYSEELGQMFASPTCGPVDENGQGVDIGPESGGEYDRAGCSDPIAPGCGPEVPKSMWAKLPEGVTPDMVEDKTGCPMIVDAGDFQRVISTHLEESIGNATMAGVMPMTARTGPTDYMRMFLQALGLKVVECQRVRVGPEGKKVRLYTLDPAWLETLEVINQRHYQLLMGESVDPLENIDPKAPKTQYRQRSRAKADWGGGARQAYQQTRAARNARRRRARGESGDQPDM